MRHTLPLALLLLAACGDSHPPADGGRTECEEALDLPEGAACDFAYCPSVGCDEPTVLCTDGQIRHIIARCFDAAADGSGLDGGVPDSGDAGAIPLCEDYSPPPPVDPACTSDAMCEDGRSCAWQHDARCGICFALESLCADDAECDGTEVCVETTHPCACAGPGSECQAACSGASCGEGFTCGSDGHCDATSCTDGYECAPNFDCVFGAAGGDAHGCARRVCTVTSDCACGACVSGQCSSGPGACQLPVP